jgi:hypothetical protein
MDAASSVSPLEKEESWPPPFEKGDRGGFYCFVGTQNRVSISVFENREEAKKEK